MDSNDILDDFLPDEEVIIVKTNWWAVFVSACLFFLFTFLKWKYLYPIVSSQWGANTGGYFIGLILLELILFLLILRKQQYLSEDSLDTVKTAYLHGVIPYGIILIIFEESRSSIVFDFILVVLGLSVIGLPIIVAATIITNFIADRYINTKP